MELNVIRAELDLTTLIYMIAVVLWVFGNLFSKNKKKGPQPPAKRRPTESTAEAELREFIERMSGQKVEPEELVEEEEVPPRQPAVRIKKPVRETNIVQAAPVMPLRKPYVPEPEEDLDVKLTTSPERHGIGMGSAFASALKSTGSSQFKLTESNISILKQSMRSSHPIPPRPTIKRSDLMNKKIFRKVMAAQIVLGTPRAFETSDVPEAIRH